jgi:hypothetical protein
VVIEVEYEDTVPVPIVVEPVDVTEVIVSADVVRLVC